ncbi:Predicted O-linked N-acetylglucosamine transferase, SPINDLY family [Sebaldella termitidis]|uniref:TPR repeat-containing protein n=1 Tax=Sebaldella termitidis (strain ATCC 33386 / NCTC 11300) TaxID=526218 RepID=D1AMU5_SEBTE|nr:tetratricopeptide repeat protein [Sebaldella termitidis]ACZ07321.1 TPR repeat-containing protein [Sebaldella termitidis ATCC 33386]SUI22613.1 Predicted O-linked N-acetylglucosamine transferase, SPINDLY family [Sebaldella termitidis]
MSAKNKEIELKDEIYNNILELTETGDEYYEEGELKKAEKAYLEALELLSEPKYDWEAGTWIYTALGDVYLEEQDYLKAKEVLYDALNCPNSQNPYIYYNLGIALFELDEKDKAQDFFMRVYMLDGETLFLDGEDKYFESIKNEISKDRSMAKKKLEKTDNVITDEANKNFEAVHFYDEMNIAYEKGDYDEVLKLLNKKWEEIPLPKEKNKESPYILRSIIEILLIKHDYMEAKKVCADYFDYDFFMNDFGEGYLLSGKIFYELGNKEEAKKTLLLAYKISGKRLFMDEKNKKYFEFLKQYL